MPELPEVETIRRGIEPHIIGCQVGKVIVRETRLRWPMPSSLPRQLAGQSFLTAQRRGKYLLLGCIQGTLIFHFGMSGSLHMLPAGASPGKHDHLDIILNSGNCLRFNDPRRFGSVLWTQENPLHHPLLHSLGPEPFDSSFDGFYLSQKAQGRRVPVKAFIMSNQVVVGIGNIYANEALFRAKIDPRRPAGRIGATAYRQLAEAIKSVLNDALQAGGTTLRNFSASDGKLGYFVQQLQVYGRAAQPCPICSHPIRQQRLGQRASFYCIQCQR
jgi:formamidopyrimidine-DNA glycosylase